MYPRIEFTGSVQGDATWWDFFTGIPNVNPAIEWVKEGHAHYGGQMVSLPLSEAQELPLSSVWGF